MAYYKSGSDSGGGSPGGSPPGRSTSRTYMCKICGNLFTSGQSLGGHMNVHRKNHSPQSSAPQSYENYYSSGGDNNQWQSSSSLSTQAYKGVRFRKEQNKWVAEIRPPKATNTWWLGTYSTPEEAAYAYDVAITYFGSESSLNFAGHPTYEQIPRISTDLQRQDYAAELRNVVKKYGKLAMEAGSTGGASTPATGEAQEELGWEDFHPPPENSACAATDYSPFDFEETTGTTQPPESSYQVSDYDQTNSYYGHGYQQHYGWPPYDPKDY